MGGGCQITILIVSQTWHGDFKDRKTLSDIFFSDGNPYPILNYADCDCYLDAILIVALSL